MDFRPIERAADDFQQSVGPADLTAMCHRAFGSGTEIVSAVELGGGMYNNTYRIDLAGSSLTRTEQIILRVAPEPQRQFRSERHYMRNEHASTPFLAPIADLIPRTLAADFTHQIIGRDYMFQSLLGGVQASAGLSGFPRAERGPFWRQMGDVLARVHSVRGPGFGHVVGPIYETWSDATIASLAAFVDDIEDVGLDATDLREVIAVAGACRPVLDEITEPRLLHGDLGPVNVMIDPDSPDQRIVGVFDCDRTRWGDPMADWTMFLINRYHGPEMEDFWATYGERPADTDNARARMLFYQARNMGEVRLERHRLHDIDGVAQSFTDAAEIVTVLRKL